jgi:hypothetical protein
MKLSYQYMQIPRQDKILHFSAQVLPEYPTPLTSRTPLGQSQQAPDYFLHSDQCAANQPVKTGERQNREYNDGVS